MKSSPGVFGAVCLSLAAVGLLSAGCAAGGASQASVEPDLGTVSTVTSSSAVRLPLSRGGVSRDDMRALGAAAMRLTAQCATRFGVKYTGPLETEVPMDWGDGRRFGIVSLDDARRYGYMAPDQAQAAGKPRANDKYGPNAWNPNAAELAVVSGQHTDGSPIPASQLPKDSSGAPLPAGGCSEWADRDLAGGKPLELGFTDSWAGDANKQAESDSRVKAAWSDWSACMTQAGFKYDTPWKASDGFGERTTPSQREITTAVADVTCRQRTNLVGRWMAVEAAYQERQIAAHEGEYHEYRQMIDTALSRAKAVLAGR